MMRIAGALALTLCASASAGAQGLTAGAEIVDAGHYLAGEPLVGVGVRVSTPLRLAGAPLFVRIGTSRSQSERFGPPCGGFVPPGECSPQPTDDRTRMTSVGVGLSSTFVSGQRFGLGMDLESTLARWTATSRGRSSGEVGNAAEIHIGVGIGFHTSFRPTTRVPLAIEVGAAAGASNKPPGYEVIDAYTPFAELITQVRYNLGIAWRR